MIIMSKFQKRLKKVSGRMENCLVVGQGFGRLQELSEIYKTVFVIDTQRPELKARNIVFRDNFDETSYMTELSAVFFDRASIDFLEKTTTLWTKCNSMVVIEGNDPIERHQSGPLYRAGWECTNLQGLFHVWELKK